MSLANMGPTTWNVHVESAETEMLLGIVLGATSGPSFAAFLETDAAQYLHEEIGLRFAYEGDSKSGAWPELAESTNEIRQALGFPPVTPINIRTGDLEAWVTSAADVVEGDREASMLIPGEPPTEILAKKLRTAQMGESGSENPFENAGATPPRPVLAADETDLAMLLVRLETHIIEWVVGAI